MEIAEVVILIGVFLLFFIGIAGIIVPIIPSLPIIWIGVVIYGFVHGFSESFNEVVLVTGLIALGGTILDAIMTMIGAKIYGASWRGMVGAFVGGAVGFVLLNVIGLIIGSFVGTLFAEYTKHHDRTLSLRAAWGTMIGFGVGTALKLILAIVMIVLFLQYVF